MTIELGSRPLVLLGAGASVEAGVPATFDMTEKLVAAIEERFSRSHIANALNFVCGALIAYDSARGKSVYTGLDVERVFAAIELLAERNELEVTPFVASWHPAVDTWDRPNVASFFDQNLARALGEKSGQSPQRLIENLIESRTGVGRGWNYRYLAKEMIVELREILTPPYDSLGYLTPLLNMAQAGDGLTIATLNYDRTIESACKEKGISVDTGIGHWINNQKWSWSTGAVRLMKLHGSIDWHWERPESEVGEMPMRTVKQSFDEPMSEDDQPVLVFGLRNKLSPDGPFLSLLREFEDKLADCQHLIIVGYSFRDEHINEIVRRWTREDETRFITLIDPTPPTSPFGRELIENLNPTTRDPDFERPPRVEVQQETAGEAFAQLVLR
jgi:SIR2-like domain